MINNQRGISLVEVLATLVILSIIGGTIWSIFFQGHSYSQNAISKNAMQQEANIILTSLKNVHQTNDKYTISTISDSSCDSVDGKIGGRIEITGIEDHNGTGTISNEQDKVFSNTRLCFISSLEETINIANKNNVPLTLTIYEKQNPTNILKINTLLFRIKEEKVDVQG
ncbi:prepilin-type N-terminal cleavage/methylation domain-containing protein [Mesobacillus persicus]|uniref:Prepilin-type N-terminal cleavage/methylation domain-containing protein n=1 Tax=Mesobacillus persicus TaxID=930146 RepID=A0A1H7XIE2_9BACI|nr:prepilin-type N-terminal cleavage/methylation domain-containing protein [Mesobacillus persicus]SEM33435.1 prepilin-type N-terminal cleavage/methylation domain-containing protein [Mesobacillus persicus]